MGYGYRVGEQFYGPFETILALLQNADEQDNITDDTTMTIGTHQYANPVHYAEMIEADDILTLMDEHSEDEYGFGEEPTFQTTTTGEYRIAFTIAITKWAADYIKSNKWILKPIVRTTFGEFKKVLVTG